MPTSVALLLDDRDNHYQQLLVRAAREAAAARGMTLREPEYAGRSAWTQVDSVNRLLRQDRPDAVLIMLAGENWTRAPFERLVKAGVAVVLLNRVPGWVDGLRRDYPKALVAAVTPRQEGVGEIQAQQALRLVPEGSLVMLVTGAASSPAAVARKAGFAAVAGSRLLVNEVDGRWTAADAEKALGDWFRVGAERERPLGLIACQNDAMAIGARSALVRVASSGRRDLEGIPIIGCDGLEEEGRAMVARRELAATVVVPPTTPAAIEALWRFRESGERSQSVALEPSSHPPVDALGPR
jgi:ribose transport system substrate-binding protein